MSHPPETSQELTDEIYNALAAVREDIDARQAIVALIDAWVRVREAEARLDESTIWRSILITSSNFPEQASSEFKTRATQLKATLATVRKQLEEKAP